MAVRCLPNREVSNGLGGTLYTLHLQVSSEEEALNLLFLGDTNRAIAATAMNKASSRSHCIFTLSLEGRRRHHGGGGGAGSAAAGSSCDRVRRSKLNLVDLAGSERVHKTAAQGQTLREARYINQSLFFLEMVILALHERRQHVPVSDEGRRKRERGGAPMSYVHALVLVLTIIPPNRTPRTVPQLHDDLGAPR